MRLRENYRMRRNAAVRRCALLCASLVPLAAACAASDSRLPDGTDDTSSKPTMIFDVKSGVKNDPDRNLLALLSPGGGGAGEGCRQAPAARATAMQGGGAICPKDASLTGTAGARNR